MCLVYKHVSAGYRCPDFGFTNYRGEKNGMWDLNPNFLLTYIVESDTPFGYECFGSDYYQFTLKANANAGEWYGDCEIGNTVGNSYNLGATFSDGWFIYFSDLAVDGAAFSKI